MHKVGYLRGTNVGLFRSTTRHLRDTSLSKIRNAPNDLRLPLHIQTPLICKSTLIPRRDPNFGQFRSTTSRELKKKIGYAPNNPRMTLNT